MIFISYSRQNSDYLKKLVEDIKDIGYDCWFDEHNIVGGQEWWNKILETIEKSDYFIFLISKDSLDSLYCGLETKYALDLKYNIIPIVIDIDVEKHLPSTLSRINYIAYYNFDKKDSNNLAKTLNQLDKNRFYLKRNISRPQLPTEDFEKIKKIIHSSEKLPEKKQDHLFSDIISLQNVSQKIIIDLLSELYKKVGSSSVIGRKIFEYKTYKHKPREKEKITNLLNNITFTFDELKEIDKDKRKDYIENKIKEIKKVVFIWLLQNNILTQEELLQEDSIKKDKELVYDIANGVVGFGGIAGGGYIFSQAIAPVLGIFGGGIGAIGLGAAATIAAPVVIAIPILYGISYLKENKEIENLITEFNNKKEEMNTFCHKRIDLVIP